MAVHFMVPLLQATALASAVVGAEAATLAPVSSREARLWIRHLIPLPKEIRIPRAARVRKGGVAVRLRAGATDVEARAARQLAALLGADVASGGRTTQGWEIVLGTCERDGTLEGTRVPGAERLVTLPNSDQAYAIAPIDRTRLAVAGLTERGVAYGAVTLGHLLAARQQGQTLLVPLLRVVDWPDLAERGEWGGNAGSDLEWMASHKLNLVELHSELKVTPEGKGQARISPEVLEEGRLKAVKIVPIITHLDQIQDSGIYRYYPELKGKGPSAQHKVFPEEVAPCFSQPRLFDILADWMTSLAEQKGVSDICVWLSEEPLQCECEGCKSVGQYALEARSIVAAWRLARQRNPRIRVRILLTQGSYPTNDRVLAEVPPEVGVTYYHGGLTYDSTRNPMIYPLLEQFAAQGRWLGCYPQLTASWRIVCPWSGPQFVRARMREFVTKRLQCLCGYATPNNRLYDFNVAAAAEWSWNVEGRSEREFAAAWATTRGLKDPDLAARWAVLLGPVGWDVYGSGIPYPRFFGSAAALLKKPAPQGQPLFRYFPDLAHVRKDLDACARAMAMARKLGAPALIAETEAITGYVRMVQALYELADALAPSEPMTEARRAVLAGAMRTLSEGGAQATSGLEAWEKACGEGLGGGRFADTVNVTEKTIVEVGKALAPYGVKEPGVAYLRREMGGWQSDDFEAEENVRKRWDVTDALAGPGTYRALFTYTSGWWGLSVSRVALASAPEGSPDALTELVVDEHAGLAAAESKANTYTLKVPEVPGGRRYYLVADIRGVRSGDKPPDRKGCNGTVTFWKVRDTADSKGQ